MKKFLTYLLFLFCQISLSATEIKYIDDLYQEAYDVGAIIGYQDEKIYLNSASLIFDEGDWLLDLTEEHYALLPEVYLDSFGYFIRYFDDETDSAIINCIEIFTECPYCGKPSFINCDNPDCVAKKDAKIKTYNEDRKRKEKEYKEKKKQDSAAQKARKKEQKEQAKKAKHEKKQAKKKKKS